MFKQKAFLMTVVVVVKWWRYSRPTIKKIKDMRSHFQKKLDVRSRRKQVEQAVCQFQQNLGVSSRTGWMSISIVGRASFVYLLRSWLNSEFKLQMQDLRNASFPMQLTCKFDSQLDEKIPKRCEGIMPTFDGIVASRQVLKYPCVQIPNLFCISGLSSSTPIYFG